MAQSVAFTLGSVRPVFEVYADPAGDFPGWLTFTVAFSDAPHPDDVRDEDYSTMCAHCLVNEPRR